MHRVINPAFGLKTRPRISIWHEICTSFQEHKELINDKTEKASTYENTLGIPMSKSRTPSETSSKNAQITK